MLLLTIMKKLFLILVLVVLLSSGCKQNFSKNSDYYSLNKNDYNKYKNKELIYTWNFNKSLNASGYTYRKDYFEVKDYGKIGRNTIPYLAQFKHEEGHIFQFYLLNISDDEEFNGPYYNNCNKIDPLKGYYFVSVSEGISEYYAIKYFEKLNMSLANEYFNDLKAGIDKNRRYLQYYRGFLFVNYMIEQKYYPNLRNFILNFCTQKQYNLYDQFIKKNGLCLKDYFLSEGNFSCN